MEQKCDAIIIGGGLAGLTAAIHLSKSGLKVILAEKNDFPKHKVCGEYISNEVLPYLNWLGLDIYSLEPAKIQRLEFSTLNGKFIHTYLPLGGFGISRYKLDHYLYNKALENGCQIIKETIADVHYEGNSFSATTSESTILKANIVLGAFGKRSSVDQKMHRNFILKKSPWLGVKAHYKGVFDNDLVGLYNFKGGYCGVSKVEDNLLNICFLANFDTFKKYKNIEDYQKNIVSKNPLLKSILDNSTMVFEKPLTISQISFDKKQAVENHILMIGDSAGLIHPLCGNGMAMAIHSAKLASELVMEFHNGAITREELERNYASKWKFNFSSRIKTGRLIAGILRQQIFSGLLMNLLVLFPSILPKIITRTHGKPIIIAE